MYNAYMNYPEIRFRDSHLLIGTIYSDIETAYMPPLAHEDERYKLSREYINKKLDEYEVAWRPYEKRLIEGMSRLLNLEFKQNVIDVYAAPFYTSFSFPLIIATKYESDRAVEVLTHELVHTLLYDNTLQDIDLMAKEQEWIGMFGEGRDAVELIHIPVHATLQALFDDVLGEPERTIRDKEMCENYPAYQKAWEYVDEVGYKTILEQIKTR